MYFINDLIHDLLIFVYRDDLLAADIKDKAVPLKTERFHLAVGIIFITFFTINLMTKISEIINYASTALNNAIASDSAMDFFFIIIQVSIAVFALLFAYKGNIKGDGINFTKRFVLLLPSVLFKSLAYVLFCFVGILLPIMFLNAYVLTLLTADKDVLEIAFNVSMAASIALTAIIPSIYFVRRFYKMMQIASGAAPLV